MQSWINRYKDKRNIRRFSDSIETGSVQFMDKVLKIVIMLVVLAAAFWGVKASGLLDLMKDYEKFKAFIECYGALGYLIYIFIYIIIAVFSIPGLIPTLVAGIVFGPVKGGILSLLGATIGATAAFLIARYLARGLIVEKFGENPVFKKIEAGVEKNGKDFLILTRLMPIFPYNLQNYAYGVTNLSVVSFAVISLITMAPGAFIYAYMAGDIAANGVTRELFLKLLLAGLVLFGASQIPKAFAKKKGIEV